MMNHRRPEAERAAGEGNTFVIRTYKPGDEEKINEMFNEVFSQQRDISHWYWKYRDNPLGSFFISLAVSGKGRLAAQYAGYPVMFYSLDSRGKKATEFLSYHIGDKMTRSRYRGVGLGRNSLLARTFMLFRETFGYKMGVPFAYGFTTHHSRRFGLLLLDYKDVGPVPYRRLDLEPGRQWPVQAGRIKTFLSRLSVEEVSDTDHSWTDFFYRVAPSYKYLIRRDASYLKWRYIERPDRRYLFLRVRRGRQMAGWSVFYREGNRIIWGDALFAPGDIMAVKSVFRLLLSHPLCKGAEFVEGWFPPRPHWWDTILQTLGFQFEPEPNDLHLTPPVFTDGNIEEVLKKDFYYTMGDSDLF